MKTMVVYQSSTGFTKQYAEWIASECNCKAVPSKEISESEIRQYDQVIYGGWIMAGMIKGLDKIRKYNPKKVIVFAVGASPDSKELRDTIKEQNHLADTPFYYFEGGIQFDKLNFLTRTMLKMMKKSLVKKENKTEQDRYMEQALSASFNRSEKRFVKPLVACVKEVG